MELEVSCPRTQTPVTGEVNLLPFIPSYFPLPKTIFWNWSLHFRFSDQDFTNLPSISPLISSPQQQLMNSATYDSDCFVPFQSQGLPFLSSIYPGRLWGSTSPMGIWDYFFGGKAIVSLMLGTHFHLMVRVMRCGAIRPSPYTSHSIVLVNYLEERDVLFETVVLSQHPVSHQIPPLRP